MSRFESSVAKCLAPCGEIVNVIPTRPTLAKDSLPELRPIRTPVKTGRISSCLHSVHSSVDAWANRVSRSICTTDAVEAVWKDLS